MQMQSRPTARPAAGIAHELLVGPGRRRTLVALPIAVAGPFLLAPFIDRLSATAGLFLVAVVAAAGVGWLWPGLVAAVSSFIAHSVFIASSENGFVLDTNGLILFGVFAAIAVLVSVEEAARARARAIQERVAFLAEANRIIATSLDFGATLQNLTHLAVPRLADWCSVHLRSEDDSTLTFRVAHANPEKIEAVEELWKRYPPDPDDPNSLVFRVLRTGQPVVLRTITDGLFETVARDDEHLRMAGELGVRSAILVPLPGPRGGAMGVLTLAQAESGRHHRRSDLPFVQELARTASTAIENARVHQERSRIAQTLQNSLLPPETPEIPGLDVAVRYRPAGAGNLVGGDFYDVFEAGERSWAVAVGDVCGKGPEAAAITGLVRQTIRTAATQEPDPSVVLSAVNHEMIRTNGDRFCTVALGRIERHNGSVRVTVSCGGHPPPLVYRPALKVEAADCLGSLLGVFPEPRLAKAPVELRPGDAVVFYTDGVTERLERTGRGGDSTLVALLWESDALSAAGIADRIYVEAAAATQEKPRDDIAIVVIRVPPASES
jgi:serine phosphatase RsbU (regulator of sigma subunit)